MSNSNSISGPLGLWTFPLLNALVQMSQSNNSNSEQSQGKSVETAKVIRDSSGEIQEVIVIKE